MEYIWIIMRYWCALSIKNIAKTNLKIKMIEERSEFDKEIDNLLAKEKVARMNNDNLESSRVLK